MSNYPSVTQALGVFQDFSTIRPDVLEHAAERGSRVHAACSAYAKGLFPVTDPESEPYFISFQQWFDTYITKTLAVEKRMNDEVYGFTGMLDLIVLIKGDKLPSLVDLKTPAAVGPTWAAQISAYRHLAEKKLKIKIGRNLSLRLSGKGTAAIPNEFTGNYNRDFAVFLAALTAYKYFKG